MRKFIALIAFAMVALTFTVSAVTANHPVKQKVEFHADDFRINHADVTQPLTTNFYMKNSLTQVGNTQLSFGEAIELTNLGKIVQRSGWNGKDMFIFQRPHDVLTADFVINKVKSLPQKVKDYYASRCEAIGYDQSNVEVKFTPYLCMKAADGTIVNGWLASQTDMLAKDWVEVDIATS